MQEGVQIDLHFAWLVWHRTLNPQLSIPSPSSLNMTKPLTLIALILCCTLPSLVSPWDYNDIRYKDMTDDMRKAFREYLREYQPFLIDRSWTLWNWTPGCIFWPEKSMHVFLGAETITNPELRHFEERTSSGEMYMDESMVRFINQIMKELNRIKPTPTPSRWFREELRDAINTESGRLPHSMSWFIKDIVERLIARTRHSDRAKVTARENIKKLVEDRYGPGRWHRVW